MLDTSGERVRIECGLVMVKMLRERALFCIKYLLRNAVFNMRVAEPPLPARLHPLFFSPLCASQGSAFRGVRFLKSRLQA